MSKVVTKLHLESIKNSQEIEGKILYIAATKELTIGKFVGLRDGEIIIETSSGLWGAESVKIVTKTS
jgi:hypothetical protein